MVNNYEKINIEVYIGMGKINVGLGAAALGLGFAACSPVTQDRNAEHRDGSPKAGSYKQFVDTQNCALRKSVMYRSLYRDWIDRIGEAKGRADATVAAMSDDELDRQMVLGGLKESPIRTEKEAQQLAAEIQSRETLVRLASQYQALIKGGAMSDDELDTKAVRVFMREYGLGDEEYQNARIYVSQLPRIAKITLIRADWESYKGQVDALPDSALRVLATKEILGWNGSSEDDLKQRFSKMDRKYKENALSWHLRYEWAGEPPVQHDSAELRKICRDENLAADTPAP